MTSFEATLARMKELYTYGRELNEDKTPTNYTIEYKAQAADGNTYGIIRECSKYYIKKAKKGKEGLAEAYDYLGGFNNKKNYEYSSYAKALKNFELKMASINEAVEGEVIISTLDPFKKEDFLIEATDAMKAEIARQKQIMFNAAQIMNESTDFAVSRANNTVMYNGENPEAETGKKGDEEYTETKAEPEYKGSKTAGVDKKAEPFKENTPACTDQLKENSDNECGILEGDACPKCGKTPCVCEEGCECNSEGDSCVKDGKPCCTGADPKNVGWDVDGQKKVNESEDDDEYAVDGDEEDDVDIEKGEEPDLGLDGDDEPESGDEDSELPTDGEEEDDDFGEDDSDIDSDDLDDTDLSDLDTELNADDDDEFDLEDEDELSSEDNEEGDEDVDMSFDDEIDFSDDDFEDDEEDISPEDFEGDEEDDGDFSPEDFGDEEDTEALGNDEEESDDSQDNSLDYLTDKIVQEVRQRLIKEDELHVFGKHPGYRKKPMELPSTGEDKNQWGEDWNDESVHSEAPFGEKIGDGTPFEKMVDSVVKNVMAKMNESLNKKKVN